MKVRRIPIYTLIIINVAVALGLLLTGYAEYLDPNTYGWISLAGYALPLFIIATIAMMLLWVFIKKRYILISFVALIATYQPVTLYCPINTATADGDMPDSLITVLSYNSSNWGNLVTSPDKISTIEEKENLIAEMVKQVNADIIVMQESPLNEHSKGVAEMYQYADTIIAPRKRGLTLTLFSRYPIIKKEHIDIESKGNACGAFWLDMNGKEVIVINTHLEVMHFSMKERTELSTIVHGNQKDHDSIRSTSHTLIGKIYNSTKKRAKQAETIAAFIKQHADTPIILAGDFNDIPNSFVHNTIVNSLNKDVHSVSITDCYQATGFGPGYTFKHFGIRERIDNIFCSSHFTPYNCHIVKDIKVSDHQPITCKLKIQR